MAIIMLNNTHSHDLVHLVCRQAISNTNLNKLTDYYLKLGTVNLLPLHIAVNK